MRPTLLIDRSDRARIEISGASAVATLNGLVTNDVSALRAGQGQYAAALTAKGKIVADMIVLMLGDRLQVHASPAAAPGLRAMLAKFVNPRFATLRDLSETTGDLTLVGPAAGALLERASGGTLSADAMAGLSVFSHVDAQLASVAVIVVRLPSIGIDNDDVFSVIVPRDMAGVVRAALHAAGATDADSVAMETLRVESGFPAWGIDMDDSTLPQEANLDEMHAVSYTKGCYIGQETLARIHFRGHVNRSLRRLVFTEGVLPPRGAVLQDSEHRAVGDVRSTARSTASMTASTTASSAAREEDGGALGIGMVRREIDDGQVLDVHWDGGATVAVVAGKARGAID